ncbi:MAG: ribonuclease P protein component [Microthrixaceae bacterium]|nr:ribonuclease P protein component [Microthrixaceae bacterium]
MVDGISDRAAFAGFHRDAPRASSGPLTIVLNPSFKVDSAQVAFAIPRRVGPAVVRNRLRRQVKAVFDELTKGPALNSGAYLVIVRAEARGSDYAQLRSWIVRAIEKLNNRTIEPQSIGRSDENENSI